MNYFIPALLLITFVAGIVKKVNLFDSFTDGIKEATSLTLNLIPYLVAVFIIMYMMRESELTTHLAKLINPLFSYLGIPNEVTELIILRPLSGSGSLVVLENIYTQYGVDSYVARVASVMMASTDTLFYVVATYLSTSKDKSTSYAIPISLFTSFLGVILASILCKYV